MALSDLPIDQQDVLLDKQNDTYRVLGVCTKAVGYGLTPETAEMRYRADLHRLNTGARRVWDYVPARADGTVEDFEKMRVLQEMFPRWGWWHIAWFVLGTWVAAVFLFFRPKPAARKTRYFGYDSGSKFFGPFEFLRKKPGCTHFRFHRLHNNWHVQVWALHVVFKCPIGYKPIGFYTMDGDQVVIELPFDRTAPKAGRHPPEKDNVRFYLRMPWALEHHRTEYLFRCELGSWSRDRIPAKWQHPSGVWIKFPRWFSRSDLGSAATWSVPFVWTDPNTGEKDNVTATVTGDRMTWRRRWLPFTDLFCFTRTDVWMSFSGEIGPNKGSWKGGITGTGAKMLPGETIEQTVARAQGEITIHRK